MGDLSPYAIIADLFEEKGISISTFSSHDEKSRQVTGGVKTATAAGVEGGSRPKDRNEHLSWEN